MRYRAAPCTPAPCSSAGGDAISGGGADRTQKPPPASLLSGRLPLRADRPRLAQLSLPCSADPFADEVAAPANEAKPSKAKAAKEGDFAVHVRAARF